MLLGDEHGARAYSPEEAEELAKSGCSIPGCDEPIRSRGWCDKHYMKWYRHGDPLYTHKALYCLVDGCNDFNEKKGRCLFHHREHTREQYQEHIETRKENLLRYRAKPKVKVRMATYNQTYMSSSRGKFIARKLAHERGAALGHYTESQWHDRLAFYGYRCYLCDIDWFSLDSFDRTIDHVIPLSLGGTNWPSNLRPACRSCNCKKNDKDFHAFV